MYGYLWSALCRCYCFSLCRCCHRHHSSSSRSGFLPLITGVQSMKLDKIKIYFIPWIIIYFDWLFHQLKCLWVSSRITHTKSHNTNIIYNTHNTSTSISIRVCTIYYYIYVCICLSILVDFLEFIFDDDIAIYSDWMTSSIVWQWYFCSPCIIILCHTNNTNLFY